MNGVLVRVGMLEQGRIGRRLTIFVVRSAWAHRDWYRVTSVSWLIIFSTLDQIVNGPVNLCVMSDKSEYKSPDRTNPRTGLRTHCHLLSATSY